MTVLGGEEVVVRLRLKTKFPFFVCSWSLEAADSFWQLAENMYIVRFFFLSAQGA